MLHAAPAILTAGPLAALALAGSAVVLLIAAFNDLAARTLPNWACLTVAGLGIALRLQDGTVLIALAIAAIVFALMLACWFRGWMGGGDVKLLAACMLLAPPAQALNLILDTTLAGGVLAAIYLVLRRIAPRPLPGRRDVGLTARIWRAECWRIARRGSLPYGCAITAGALIILFIPLS